MYSPPPSACECLSPFKCDKLNINISHYLHINMVGQLVEIEYADSAHHG
jgi:hypothetical protein